MNAAGVTSAAATSRWVPRRVNVQRPAELLAREPETEYSQRETRFLPTANHAALEGLLTHACFRTCCESTSDRGPREYGGVTLVDTGRR